MRKRSKKRIPQDIKAWRRVIEADDDKFFLPSKKTARWTSGGRRDWNTRVLNSGAQCDTKDLIRNVCAKNSIFSQKLFENNHSPINKKINSKKILLSKNRALSKYKNICLFSGRSRTYNRNIFMARHQVRKLINIGAIPGFSK